MHIIVLENYPSSQRGGQERSLIDVTRQLAQRGHRITLLHANPGNLLPQYEAFCDQIIPVHGFEISRSRWQSPLYFLADLWKVYRRLQTQAMSEEPSIIYLNQPYDLPFGALLSGLTQIPIVCHLRLPSPLHLGIQRQLTIHRVQQFIAVSESTRQGWLAYIKAPIAVIHNGVLPDRLNQRFSYTALREQWKIPQDDRVVCYVGRLDSMKGLTTLVKAFAKLLETQPNSQLIIAGKPSRAEDGFPAELEQLCTQLGIVDRVRLMGFVANVTELFHLSDVSVLPSHWAEPFGRSIIESMMAGTPVIASDVGGISEILTGEFAAGLFPPRDVDALERTLQSYLNWRSEDPTLGDRHQAHARQRFHLEDKIDAIEQILLNVAPQNRVEGAHYAAPQR
jgi:glycosyltransferase involved in cell wall biosynthesis